VTPGISAASREQKGPLNSTAIAGGPYSRHLTRIRAATGSLCSTSSYPLCILNSVQVIHTYTTPLLWTTSHNVNHHASSKLIADAEHEERHRNTQITGVIRTSSLWFVHSSGHASCGPWAFKHPIVSGAFTPAGLDVYVDEGSTLHLSPVT
jgi:hypothetical protein